MNLFKDKKVLVFGLGLNQGGVGSAQFFAKQGAIVKITDLKNKDALQFSLQQLKDFNISYTLGKHKYEDVTWADLIIKNPAVKPGNPFIEYALKKGKVVETDMGIFLQYVKPNQIIGVTGTKGKSTTASLIHEVLNNLTHKINKKSAGVNTNPPQGWISDIVFAGNIGVSVLDTILFIREYTLVVLEVSSFQLESFEEHKVSPKWAVITNITPDHLNYYQSMDEYIQAKRIIGKYQTPEDFLFIKKNDPVVDHDGFLKGLQAKIIRFSKDDLPEDFKPTLLGEHNKENIAATLAVGKTFGLNETLILKTSSYFKGVPFRMELIKIWHGVKIYNDTAATSPEAGIQAVKSLGAKLSHLPGGIILICGGMNKKMDYTKYAESLSKNVKKVFFLEGDSTDAIRSSLRAERSNLPTQGPYNDMEKLLTDVRNTVKSGDIILFSPAATSFNLFQNEFDRGRKFNQAVEKVFK